MTSPALWPDAVLLGAGRPRRFRVHPGKCGRLLYVHLDDDEDVAVSTTDGAVVHGQRVHEVAPFAYRHPPGSGEMDVRPLRRELVESIGDCWIVELPDDRRLLVPA